jgi:hypothetical protein
MILDFILFDGLLLKQQEGQVITLILECFHFKAGAPRRRVTSSSVGSILVAGCKRCYRKGILVKNDWATKTWLVLGTFVPILSIFMSQKLKIR